jgi:hypothetical protein
MREHEREAREREAQDNRDANAANPLARQPATGGS